MTSPAQSVETLEAELLELQIQKNETARRLRQVQQKHRREQVRTASFNCSPAIQKKAVAVYILSGYDTNLAVTYLKVARACPANADVAQWRMHVEDWFLAHWPPDEIVSLWFPELPDHLWLREKALRFLAEANVVAWIRERNLGKGSAPASGEVWQEHQRQLALQGRSFVDADEDEAELPQLQRAARKFAHALRKRWRVPLRQLRCRDYEFNPQDDLRRVCASNLLGCVLSVSRF